MVDVITRFLTLLSYSGLIEGYGLPSWMRYPCMRDVARFHRIESIWSSGSNS